MNKIIGILTGDGDCPGINAVIRAIVRKSLNLGNEVIGFRKSWKGILEKDIYPLDINSVSDIIGKGGTILGSSRTNPFKYEDGPEKILRHLHDLNVNVLIAVGSIDTLMVAEKLYERGCPVIGIPKTIDNDLPLTDRTFGFDTAISTVTDAIDHVHSTAESRSRDYYGGNGTLHRLDCHVCRDCRRRPIVFWFRRNLLVLKMSVL